ncbi:unnamed protein product [Mesocestoides corti]|uniref:HIT domain-containing protein n=1 Tax=Mesocestoides corti TaxID=53468 RepID=A0A0R3UAS9_MESCO|nr:unnamed protein product [Mesocestoides corti]
MLPAKLQSIVSGHWERANANVGHRHLHYIPRGLLFSEDDILEHLKSVDNDEHSATTVRDLIDMHEAHDVALDIVYGYIVNKLLPLMERSHTTN